MTSASVGLAQALKCPEGLGFVRGGQQSLYHSLGWGRCWGPFPYVPALLVKQALVVELYVNM